MYLDPIAVRRGWRHALAGDAELHDARERTVVAAGTAMDDLAGCLSAAASDLRGVLDVVSAVIAEHTTGIERCLTDFEATDGRSAGDFRGLAG